MDEEQTPQSVYPASNALELLLASDASWDHEPTGVLNRNAVSFRFQDILHKMLTPFFKELPNSFYFSKTWIMLTKQNHDQINTKYSQLFNKYYRI